MNFDILPAPIWGFFGIIGGGAIALVTKFVERRPSLDSVVDERLRLLLEQKDKDHESSRAIAEQTINDLRDEVHKLRKELSEVHKLLLEYQTTRHLDQPSKG